MADHTIKITISTTPGIVLDYEQITDGVSHGAGSGRHARVKHNDTIRWHCDAGDFAVLFKRNPLDIGALSGQAGGDTQVAHATAVHAGPAGKDNYAYLAVVSDGGNPRFEDPDIIIDP